MHPALRKLEKQSKSELDQVKEWASWRMLSDEEKHFLALYIFHRDAKKAAEGMNLPLAWMEEREEQNLDFFLIVRAIMEHPVNLAEVLLQENLPNVVMHLKGLIEQDENKLAKLGAIKEWLSRAGMKQGELSLNQYNIRNFISKEIEGEVVN